MSLSDHLRRFARLMPNSLRRFLGFSYDYIMRLRNWYHIALAIRGETVRDSVNFYSSIILSPITSFRDFDRWQDPVLLRDVIVNVSNIGKFTLRHHTDDLWHVSPNREPSVLKTIRSLLKEGDIFVDAGANIGFYTVLAGKIVGSNGRVIAIEMMPETTCILKQHVSINHLTNVVIIEQALADEAGKEIAVKIPEGQHGQASIMSSKAPGNAVVYVRTTTLAQVLSDIEEVALMKMDLEGAELLALEGAGDTLQRIRGIIYEDWGDERVGNVLRSEGFSVERLDGSNSLAINLRYNY